MAKTSLRRRQQRESDLVRPADDHPLDVGKQPARRLGDSVRVLGRLRTQLDHVEAKVYENVASSTTRSGPAPDV
jgi:hypothetical protein